MQLKIAIVHPCSSVSPYVTISAGVATTIPRLNDSISAFVSRADHALYQAKQMAVISIKLL